MAQPPSQPRAYSQAYLPNGGAQQPSGPVPGARPLDPNQGRVQQLGHARVLCIADVRGNLRQLNELARNAQADYIIHTGDFGFYDDQSLERIAEKTLKHVAQYSPLLPEPVKADIARAGPQQSIKDRFRQERLPLSELPQFLNKSYRLEVPVYTVWGACEDVSVLEKLRSQEYKIDNLHIIDESHSRLLDVGGIKLRLLGLGGAVVMHKLFDNGEGRTTIAGGQGTMWTTLLQMGELIDTANRVYDPTETRVLVTHASPAREGLLNQLSVALKADFSLSAGLHFRYGSSYNEFSVNPSLDHYRGKLSASKASFNDVWETVKHEVEPAVSENEAQNKLLQYALELVSKMPTNASGGNPFGGGGQINGAVDESAFKNMWNFNLADAAFGWLVLDIDQGRIGTEMRAQGFNFSHRSGKTPQRPQGLPQAPVNATMQPTGGNLPTPGQQSPSVAQQQARPPQQGPPQPQQVSNVPAQHRGQPPNAQQQARPGKQQSPAPGSKPATPQAALTTNADEGAKPETPFHNKQNNAGQSPQQQEPSKGIFVMNGPTSVDEVKSELFTAEDAAKITSVDKAGPPGRWAVHFASPEIMQEVLKHGTNKEHAAKHKTVRMSAYRPNPSRGNFGGAGGWGPGSRGGHNNRGGPEGRGGYQSAGGATTGSDSESGRGGRGRGRGGAFREQNRGRGGHRGRGGERGGKADGSAAAAGPAAGDS
ncbi:hypothetical protein DOTSEDRAFT_68659 [Dothistroma septosporum NZE10]|uniref:Uncharacterized protein n=1 Tax=Dothistroma septosporum (strain NZE10 / CBS 128990) TaxID=675120 RepID=N1Q4V1_DOTSN|nr:hypothetical protein DOTSEDRAFT_68659 [Dothistroma septosporum NZE10]